MTLAALAARGRLHAESIMADTCTITRKGDGETYDEDTFQSVPAAHTTVYSGKCRVRGREVLSREVDTAGQAVTLATYVVSIPVEETGVQVADLVTVTASNDPALLRSLTVKSVEVGTYATARRLLCADDQG